MPTIPNYLLGRHITLQVASITIDESTGALTPGTFSAITAELDAYQGATQVSTEQIAPLGGQARNPVPLESGTVFEVTEVMRNQAQDSVLRTLFASSAYFAVKATEGAGATPFNLYGLCTELGRKATRGKNTVTARIESIDIGSSNPWFG